MAFIDVIVKDREIVLSYCRTCFILRPPRAFHCTRCNACIQVHGINTNHDHIVVDHHCPWIGTCIGDLNHKYFVLFLGYTSLHATFTFIVDVIVTSRKYRISTGNNFRHGNYAAWVLIFYSGVLAITLFFFFLYHLILAARGVTSIHFYIKTHFIDV